MRPQLYSWLATGTLLGSLCALPASADTRAAGQTFAYVIVHISNSTVDYSSLPAAVRKQAEAMHAMGNGKKQTTNVTLTLDQVDAAGNAHFKASYTQSMEGVSGIAAAGFAAVHKFIGTLNADGRVLPASDPNMKMNTTGPPNEAQMENTWGQQMQATFADFNAFVIGCSKHGQPKIGDAWRVVIQDSYGQNHEYNFSVSAGTAGAPLVAMTSEASNYKLSASGHYDAARRLLVDFHEDTSTSMQGGPGPSMSGTDSNDFTLRQ